MSQIISQYDSPENAQKTIERLRELGFGDEHMRLGSSPSERRWSVHVRPPFGTARMAMQAMQRNSPVGIKEFPELEPGNDRTLISQLSGPVSPGAISELSRPQPVGAIAALSRRKPPGAIAVLSRRVNPGAISRLSAPKPVGAIARLSRPVPVGAIARLSQPKPVGAISRLSAGWHLSEEIGLPLLIREEC